MFGVAGFGYHGLRASWGLGVKVESSLGVGRLVGSEFIGARGFTLWRGFRGWKTFRIWRCLTG